MKKINRIYLGYVVAIISVIACIMVNNPYISIALCLFGCIGGLLLISAAMEKPTESEKSIIDKISALCDKIFKD